jgi:hypothetical protein
MLWPWCDSALAWVLPLPPLLGGGVATAVCGSQAFGLTWLYANVDGAYNEPSTPILRTKAENIAIILLSIAKIVA